MRFRFGVNRHVPVGMLPVVVGGVVGWLGGKLHYLPASFGERAANRDSEVSPGRGVRVATIGMPDAIETVGREDSVCVGCIAGRHSIDLVPTTEGFYDTALKRSERRLNYEELYQGRPTWPNAEGVPQA